MNLYLVRHGAAVPAEVDPSSPLSERGRRETEMMSKHLKLGAIDVWHSSKLRAKQTAQILMPNSKLIEKDALTPNSSTEVILKEIARLKEDTMIISHLPFLSNLLTDLNLAPIPFSNTMVVALEKENDAWHFRFVKTPKDFQ